MKRLNSEKLRVTFVPGISQNDPLSPRRYTLTHSDVTAEIFLSIGPEYDRQKVSQWHTRFMRDEVLAEWVVEGDEPCLVVHCHVSGGVVFGSAGMRHRIFRQELPLALEAIRFGDRSFIQAHPELDESVVRVRFHATQARYNVTEIWGQLKDYS